METPKQSILKAIDRLGGDYILDISDGRYYEGRSKLSLRPKTLRIKGVIGGDIRAKDREQLLDFFEFLYPDYPNFSAQYILDYNDYEYVFELVAMNADVYLTELMSIADLKFIIDLINYARKTDQIIKLIEYAIKMKAYKFLTVILDQDLTLSTYEQAYRIAHEFNDDQAKDLIWNKINRQTLVRFELIDKQLHPDLRRSLF